ncbi:hypothetical protein CASFOL_019385 [Castilleja foliolosa]|uniref:50S ribosomal protein 5, chloroplastic n=1 Tax=Castilleja foliolosa TaxID=1961234 RepID=A0ABD3D476_9LAMI
MALLFTSSFPSLSSPSSSTSRLAANPFIRLCCNKSISLHLTKANVGVKKIQGPFTLNNRSALIAKASSDGNGPEAEAPITPPSDIKEKSVPVENLPLESKLQLLQEQRIKMKLAKKIRLRRKRLVRKRHLRKKGRWPPSKLKKNKNV